MGGVGGAGGSGGTPGGSGSADDSKNPLAKIWAAYNNTLERHPIATKAFTSLVGFFLGDFIAQKFLGDKDADIDKGRLLRMASFGFLLHGTTGHFFYGALDRLIVGTGPLQVASKVAIDQLLWAPIFTVMFFAYLGVCERKTQEDIKNKIKNDTWIGVSTSWKVSFCSFRNLEMTFWPPFSFPTNDVFSATVLAYCSCDQLCVRAHQPKTSLHQHPTGRIQYHSQYNRKQVKRYVTSEAITCIVGFSIGTIYKSSFYLLRSFVISNVFFFSSNSIGVVPNYRNVTCLPLS